MSLRWRVLGALLAVILLTVSLSIGVAYWSAQRELDQLSAEISEQETVELAQYLSIVYSRTNDWSNLESALLQSGYLYDEGFWAEMAVEAGLTEEELEEGEAWFDYDPVRVLIVAPDRSVLLDSYGELEPGEAVFESNQSRGVITDLRTRQPVGYVYAEVDAEFFVEETASFLAGTLTTTLLGGLLTAVVILLPAFWMARRLTAPITALTKATQIIAEITSLRTLVDDLNRLADSDAGALSLTLEPCDVARLLAAEIARWEAQAQQADVDLVLQPGPELPIIDLDPARFSQVMGNLLHNALQHTGAGGVVIVSTQRRPIPMEPGQWVVMTVADDGPGIDPVDLPHIFDRFYRADRARTRQGGSAGGSGLGLAIARTLVRRHGGYIWVESTPGEGAAFFVALRSS